MKSPKNHFLEAIHTIQKAGVMEFFAESLKVAEVPILESVNTTDIYEISEGLKALIPFDLDDEDNLLAPPAAILCFTELRVFLSQDKPDILSFAANIELKLRKIISDNDCSEVVIKDAIQTQGGLRDATVSEVCVQYIETTLPAFCVSLLEHIHQIKHEGTEEERSAKKRDALNIYKTLVRLKLQDIGTSGICDDIEVDTTQTSTAVLTAILMAQFACILEGADKPQQLIRWFGCINSSMFSCYNAQAQVAVIVQALIYIMNQNDVNSEECTYFKSFIEQLQRKDIRCSTYDESALKCVIAAHLIVYNAKPTFDISEDALKKGLKTAAKLIANNAPADDLLMYIQKLISNVDAAKRDEFLLYTISLIEASKQHLVLADPELLKSFRSISVLTYKEYLGQCNKQQLVNLIITFLNCGKKDEELEEILKDVNMDPVIEYIVSMDDTAQARKYLRQLTNIQGLSIPIYTSLYCKPSKLDAMIGQDPQLLKVFQQMSVKDVRNMESCCNVHSLYFYNAALKYLPYSESLRIAIRIGADDDSASLITSNIFELFFTAVSMLMTAILLASKVSGNDREDVNCVILAFASRSVVGIHFFPTHNCNEIPALVKALTFTALASTFGWEVASGVMIAETVTEHLILQYIDRPAHIKYIDAEIQKLEQPQQAI